jgi:AmmeMemoRadiSam system protein B/AmmeMemoRadiSam system protein A
MFMRKIFLLSIFVVLLASCNLPVKDPSVAGAFYPADKETLKKNVEGYLGKPSNQSTQDRLLALISPHAGYIFSGQVAAYGYRQLKGRDIDTVILLGPSHYESFKGASVYTEGRFRTPLGDIRVDSRLARDLINKSAGVDFIPKAYDKEHSLEVQLPFLQSVLGDFKIVPVLISMPDNRMFQYLSEKIAEELRRNRKAIVIASTDLSHYHDYQTAVGMDMKMIDAIQKLSPSEPQRLMAGRQAEMCGGWAVLLVIDAVRKAGANQAVLYNYANSGDVTNDKQRVVGYASMGIQKSPFSKDDRKGLLDIARKAITEKVKNGKASGVVFDEPKFKAHGAVFVTIKRNGMLRGCIGHINPVTSLGNSVKQNAVAACSMDRRFPPMKENELGDMELEISVLTPLQPLKDVNDLKVGKHGLYILKDRRAGLLLPQVATDNNWDSQTFLRQVCLKAGLPEDAWRDATLYTFEAEIISEEGHGI